jgi:hypothetical protein
MLEGLIAATDPHVLAELARGKLGKKLGELEMSPPYEQTFYEQPNVSQAVIERSGVESPDRPC